MYPTIHSFGDSAGVQNPLHAPYPGASSGSGSVPSPSQPAAAQPPARANGPPVPPAPAFPTLQVAIDPKFAVAPPVQAPPQPPGEGGSAAGAGGSAPPPPPGHPAPGSREPVDLGLERKLLQDLAGGGSGGSGGGSDGDGAGGLQHAAEDPYDTLLRRYGAQGFSRQEVAMGLAVVGPEAHDDADKIKDACTKYKSLVSMGFRSEQAVAALILAEGNEQAAVDTCLAASEAAGA